MTDSSDYGSENLGYNEFLINSALYDSLNSTDQLSEKLRFIKNLEEVTKNKIAEKNNHHNLWDFVENKKDIIQNIVSYEFDNANEKKYKVFVQIPENLDSLSLDDNLKIATKDARDVFNNKKKIDEFIQYPNNFISRFLIKTGHRITIMVNFSSEISQKDLMKKLIGYYSYSLIFMLPFTGFILYLLYYNSKKPY